MDGNQSRVVRDPRRRSAVGTGEFNARVADDKGLRSHARKKLSSGRYNESSKLSTMVVQREGPKGGNGDE